MSRLYSFVMDKPRSAAMMSSAVGLDPELTPEGLQMQGLLPPLMRETLAAIYSSGLRRAIDTAQPLCDALGITMQVRPELNDWLRQVEGQTREKVGGDIMTTT